MRDEIAKALEEVRPRLQMDGGDVEFVGLEDAVVKVKLVGHCAGCPMSQMTHTRLPSARAECCKACISID